MLGNVISSGVKILVLAVIVGIGSTLFSQFTSGFGGNQPTIDNAMALMLAALIAAWPRHLRPGIANGIVSGGPQLGAGAAVGTGLAAGGVGFAGAALRSRAGAGLGQVVAQLAGAVTRRSQRTGSRLPRRQDCVSVATGPVARAQRKAPPNRTGRSRCGSFQRRRGHQPGPTHEARADRKPGRVRRNARGSQR